MVLTESAHGLKRSADSVGLIESLGDTLGRWPARIGDAARAAAGQPCLRATATGTTKRAARRVVQKRIESRDQSSGLDHRAGGAATHPVARHRPTPAARGARGRRSNNGRRGLPLRRLPVTPHPVAGITRGVVRVLGPCHAAAATATPDIARALGQQRKTIQNYSSRILDKLQVTDRTQAALRYTPNATCRRPLRTSPSPRVSPARRIPSDDRYPGRRSVPPPPAPDRRDAVVRNGRTGGRIAASTWLTNRVPSSRVARTPVMARLVGAASLVPWMRRSRRRGS